MALAPTLLLTILLAVAAAPATAQVDDERERALQLLRADAYDDAVRAYRRIVAADPDNPRAHYDLATTLGFLQRYPEAVEPIEEAMRLAPDSLPAHRAASIIYLNAHDDRRAFEASLRAAELGDNTAMFELVWMYRDGRGTDPRPAQALAWAELAAQSGHVAAMDLLVRAYLNGDYGAEIDFARARDWALAAWRSRQPER